jgi:hypothetical protein
VEPNIERGDRRPEEVPDEEGEGQGKIFSTRRGERKVYGDEGEEVLDTSKEENPVSSHRYDGNGSIVAGASGREIFA